jgi:hypothetical protein
LPGANTLTFLASLSATKEKCFITLRPGVVDLLVGLVKLGKVDPQKLELADGLLRVDGLAEASKNFLFAAAK